MPDGLERFYLETISGARRGYGPAGLRAALAAAAVPYAGLMRVRNLLFDLGVRKAVDLRRPTVSVGNVTAGGTGKTPVVRWLARRLLTDGLTPAVLTRGYAKREGPAGSPARSDEADLLTRALGPAAVVEVNADRVAGAAGVLRERPDVTAFVLDDGFQHRRAARDFDLVLVNAVNPFGYGHVHPRGLLREPLAGLRRATVVLLTHTSRAGASDVDRVTRTLRRYAGDTLPVFRCDHVLAGLRGVQAMLTDKPERPTTDLADRPFFAIAGVGHPEGFEAQLRAFGDRFVGRHWFGDHFDYTPADVEAIVTRATALGASTIVTTEKDWAKLVWIDAARTSPVPFVRADLGLRFHDDHEQRLYNLIVERLRSA